MRVPDFASLIARAEFEAVYCRNCGKHYDQHWVAAGDRRVCPSMQFIENSLLSKLVFFDDKIEGQDDST